MAHEICSELLPSTYSNIFLAKLDIKKLFDTMNRQALLHCMSVKGCPPTFIKWVDACISNVDFSVVLNGEIKGYFSSVNGLREGCPLSPFLFTIVMDTLSQLFNREVNFNRYVPLVLGNYKLFHLLMTSWL